MAALRFTRQSSLSVKKIAHKIDNTSLIQINQTVDDHGEEDEGGTDESMKLVFKKDALLHESFNIEGENVCTYALKTFYEAETLQSHHENKGMLQYIQQLFQLDNNTFKSLSSNAQEIVAKEKTYLLKCKIIKASDISERSHGKSNAFCVLCILDKQYIESKLVRNNNIEEWVAEKIVQNVRKTTVKQETLNPTWNESFELIINDYKAQYLVIELWHSDAAPTTRIGQFIADITKDQDFLGRAFYPIQNVPIGGIEGTLALLSHSAKHTRGTLTVWMNVTGQKEDKSIQQILLEYKELLQSIVMKETEVKGSSSSGKEKDDHKEHVKQWDGKISETGEKLLRQTASLRSITPLQQSVIRLSVFIDYNKIFGIKISALGSVLQSILANSDESMKILKESSTGGSVVIPLWVEKHIEDLKELSAHILDIMKQHLFIFNSFKSEESIRLLRSYVIVLRDLYQIQLFKAYMSNEQINTSTVLTNAIQAAVSHWMLIMSDNFMPAYDSSESSMIALKGLCLQCLKQCQRSYDKINPVFQEVSVDYFSPFYTSLSKLLYKELEIRLDRGNKETSLLTYEIYCNMQEISKFDEKVDPEFLAKHDLKIVAYSELFKVFVSDWIRMAQTRAEHKIRAAIELDTIVKLSDEATFSSSAVDANAFFLQVIRFWKDLKWPDRGQSIGFLMQIMECLQNISVYYANELFAKVKEEHQTTDKDGHLIVSDQLCVALNNIHHIREVLSESENALDLPSYYQWLDEGSQEGSRPLSKHASTILATIMKLISDVLFNKVNVMAAVVIDELSPHVLEFLAMIITTDPNVAPDKVLDPMINYISGNVGKFGKVLLTPVLIHILKKLWIKIVLTLREEYNKIPHTPKNPLLSRMNYVVLNLAEFFEAGGSGISRSDIETKQFLALRYELSLAVAPTEEVIRVLNSDMLKQQADSKANYGTLHMSHIYDPAKKAVVVDIVSAQHIPALDRTGKSDPYIQLFLLPSTSFVAANENVYKTGIQKQTLDPLFKETIELPADPAELKKDGSILLMAMFDYDVLISDDFAGLCVVSCDIIPQEGKEPKVNHLNLFHYKETDSYKELSLRHTDHEAVKLVKTMKKFR